MSARISPRRSLHRSLSVATAGALVLAALPAGPVAANEHTEARDTGFVCQEPYDSEFDDVDETNSHVENIRCAADHEIALGDGDGNFLPARGVRRDQMASFVVRLIETAGGEELEPGDGGFDDVSEENPHSENISKLANIEVALGDGDGNYHPAVIVDRDQMASFIRRAISWLDNQDARDGTEPPDAEDHFADVAEENPHRGAINALAEQRIVVGNGEGDYRPRRDVRRDQMTSFLMRGYDYAVEAGVVDPLGPTPQGTTSLSSDRIEVAFDDVVTVEEVEGFRVYTDDACSAEVAHGTEHQGDGSLLIDVTLSAEMDSEEDHWFRLDARSVVNGDGFPNVESDCLAL